MKRTVFSVFERDKFFHTARRRVKIHKKEENSGENGEFTECKPKTILKISGNAEKEWGKLWGKWGELWENPWKLSGQTAEKPFGGGQLPIIC